MSFKKSDGYYKHYNKEGKSCRIKFTQSVVDTTILNKNNITIYFKNKNSDTPSVLIKSGFKCDSDVIHYILKNLDNNDMIFEVAIKYRKC